MFSKINYITLLIYIALSTLAFFSNFYIASRGLFPVDSFIHYDFGYRILLGDDPVRDYWIVHGFVIDYIQAFFFKIFGNNWHSYLFHSSIFNVIIVIFTFFILRDLNVSLKKTLLVSISTSFLAYPVSGTPFLDLHSTFFSLFAIYLVIISIAKNKIFLWFYVFILLFLAFLSKQVPAAYTIIGVSILNLYFTIFRKNLKIFLYFLTGGVFSLLTLFVFLLLNKISITDFIFQILIFPPSIGIDRYEKYNLTFKNLVLDYKFIYIIFIPLILINVINFWTKVRYTSSKEFEIFLVILVFTCSTLFHQVYTKNQIYIFFLIPILSGLFFYYEKFINKRFRLFSNLLVILICIFVTFKYHQRFNLERKFHELTNVNISNHSDAIIIDEKLKGLKWITPYSKDPNREIQIINDFIFVLKKDKDNKILITEYNFLSSLLNENLNAPSRTYDLISYPRKNSKYFQNYKDFLINKIKNKKIKKIYVFEPFSKYDHNEIILNYISESCFDKDDTNKSFTIYKIKNCNYLR